MKRFAMLVVLGLAATGCDHMGGGPSKVAHGQLYQVGDQRFDAFFRQVHEQQVAGSTRADERRNAHKAIAAALDLTPDASNDQIVRALKERKDKGSTVIEAPVDETIRADLERARRLKAMATRCEQLRGEGRALADEQKREWENRGSEKADDKKTDKRLQLRHEIDAANDAMEDIGHDARREAKKTDDFVDEIAKRIGKEVVHDAPPEAPKPPEEPKKKDPPKPKAQDTVPRRPKPVPEAPPKPDAPKAPDEVFNP